MRHLKGERPLRHHKGLGEGQLGLDHEVVVGACFAHEFVAEPCDVHVFVTGFCFVQIFVDTTVGVLAVNVCIPPATPIKPNSVNCAIVPSLSYYESISCHRSGGQGSEAKFAS